jgi:glucose-1-phosphatase
MIKAKRKSPSRQPKALLFDLGGVVIDIDFSRVFTQWAKDAGCEMAAIRGLFRMDDLYRDFECGIISSAEFFEGLRQSLKIDLTDQQFITGWNHIFVGEVAGMGHLLRSTAKKLPLYAFSNTNEIHVAHMLEAFGPILSHFEVVFTSSAMGMRKPDPQAFELVCQEINVKPSELLFFDDTPENIASARDCSIPSVHVKSIKSIIEELNARIA